MKYVKKITGWVFGILFILVLLAMGLTHLIEQQTTLSELTDHFDTTGFQPEEHETVFDEGTLYYVTYGDSTKTPLLLIHGSPGDWTGWKELMVQPEVYTNYFIIAIDRIPYHQTTIKGSYSLTEQSDYLKPVMDRYCSPCVVAGHSYGGALALQVGAAYPDQVAAVLSIAGTIAAPFQKPKWYNRVLDSPLQYLIAPFFRASNNEMLRLSDDLYPLEKQLANTRIPLFFIQGGADVLVAPESATYLQSKIPDTDTVLYYDALRDHFVIWSDIPIVLEALEAIRLKLNL